MTQGCCIPFCNKRWNGNVLPPSCCQCHVSLTCIACWCKALAVVSPSSKTLWDLTISGRAHKISVRPCWKLALLLLCWQVYQLTEQNFISSWAFSPSRARNAILPAWYLFLFPFQRLQWKSLQDSHYQSVKIPKQMKKAKKRPKERTSKLWLQDWLKTISELLH